MNPEEFPKALRMLKISLGILEEVWREEQVPQELAKEVKQTLRKLSTQCLDFLLKAKGEPWMQDNDSVFLERAERALLKDIEQSGANTRNKPHSILLSSNGTSSVRDTEGEYADVLIKNWFIVYLEYVESQGYDPLEIKFRAIVNGNRCRFVPSRLEDGWVWKIVDEEGGAG